MTTTHFHNCGFAVPQINTVPSIPYSTINANHKPEPAYLGHGNTGGIQLHSMDLGFARYGLVLRCVEGANGRRLWQALKNERVVFSHPKHDAALAGAVMILTGGIAAPHWRPHKGFQLKG